MEEYHDELPPYAIATIDADEGSVVTFVTPWGSIAHCTVAENRRAYLPAIALDEATAKSRLLRAAPEGDEMRLIHSGPQVVAAAIVTLPRL